MQTAYDLWQKLPTILPTGSPNIDRLLHGGFRQGLLHEICGEASSGKTQLCLQLLLQMCLEDEAACYVSTEGIGSIKRLHELAGIYADRHAFALKKRRRGFTGDTQSGSKFFLDRIFIEHIYEIDELIGLLQSRLPSLLTQKQVTLVVIDSIAALFRPESTKSIQDVSERARLMFQIANSIKILCGRYNVVFIVTNQVSSIFEPNSRENRFKPALGLSWSNCIHQRLVLSRDADTEERHVKVAFSPYIPQTRATFSITQEGVF
uniref:DNA repair protein XRCC3 putative n=1 Tax=Albugo laibachii Nc14 TaxID=890382 RepID=F0WIS9_9STRA|nr:DNA repair protein XRCC3 putative [Albugo laibachii Nc14]|eukprot:CCA21173.1 DNA repair protein XRCC3 putative [Albugo laibachii Nc14]